MVDAAYQGMSMESAARKLVVPPNRSVPVFLRAVETRLGPSEGKLTLKHAGGELTAPIYFDVRPLVPLRVRILDERGTSGCGAYLSDRIGRTGLHAARCKQPDCGDEG